MSAPAVYLAASDPVVLHALGAAFEEESVPLMIEPGDGDALIAARNAARRSPLGIGIGVDALRIVVALSTGPFEPYIERPLGEARALGHDAARLAARRPLEVSP